MIPRVFNERTWVFREISAYWRYLDLMSIVLFDVQVNNKMGILLNRIGIVGLDENQ